MMEDNNYPVIVKSYELTLWYIKKLSTLPKNHRFTLGQEIQNELISLMMRLTEAVYSKEKKELLKSANLNIEKIYALDNLYLASKKALKGKYQHRVHQGFGCKKIKRY